MAEAASSLSRLHLEGQKREHRMSRVFSSGEKAKRLSRQAEDEIEVSMGRIRDLESTLLRLQLDRSQLELKVVRHHSALLAQNALHNQAEAKSIGGPRGMGHARTDSSQTMRANNYDMGADVRDEIAILAMKVKAALPKIDFKDPTDIAVVSAGIKTLIQDRGRLSGALQDSRADAAAHRTRAEQLHYQIGQREAAEDPVEMARLNAELAEVQRNLDAEQTRTNQLRLRSEAQRQELEHTVASLEEVTRLAVDYEHERSVVSDIVDRLEERVKELEAKDLDAEAAARLVPAGSSGILCREFRSILHEQQQKHWIELRRLRELVINLNRKPAHTPTLPTAVPMGTSTPPQSKSGPETVTQATPTPPQPSPRRVSGQSDGSPKRIPRSSSYMRYEAQAEPVQMPASPVRVPEQLQVQSPMATSRMSRYAPQPKQRPQLSKDDYDLL